MSVKALIEIRDVIHLSIEFRAPKKGELTWAVPADVSLQEALEQVLVGRGVWTDGEGGFGYRTLCADTPEFEFTADDEKDLRLRNIVVHVEHVRTEPPFRDVIPLMKLL